MNKQVSLKSYFLKGNDSANETKTNLNGGKEEVLQKNVWMKRKSPDELLLERNPAVAGANKKTRILPNSLIPSAIRPQISQSDSFQRTSSSSSSSARRSSGNFQAYRSSSPKNTSFSSDVDNSDEIETDPEKERAKQELLSKVYQLSFSQKKALEAIMKRKSVFYTGAAGTGKSFILKVLLDILEVLGLTNKIAITAPTGVAACNIRGLTIHSWSGIGLGAESLENLLPIVERNRNAKSRWKDTEILIIDEISMLSGELFDKLDMIGRRMRNCLLPFGGLQLILCGDFFQLPPIGVGRITTFCFESNAWKELFGNDFLQEMSNSSSASSPSSVGFSSPLSGGTNKGEVILLDKIFRQQNDRIFLNVLNHLRKGQVTNNINSILSQKVQESLKQKRKEEEIEQTKKLYPLRPEEHDNEEEAKVKPTKLFSTNQDVDSFNLKELQQLLCDDDPRIFTAYDEGKDPYLGQLRAGTKAPQTLQLKIGAQVRILTPFYCTDLSFFSVYAFLHLWCVF
jgi:ATP-dependent DNA helicase PIF1